MLGHLFNIQQLLTIQQWQLFKVVWDTHIIEVLQSMMSSYVFIIFNDIQVHDGRDTLGCATLW